MMNRFEGSGSREAKIRYLDGDFQILLPGGHVTCARSQAKPIPIDELKYWSVDRQEPYADASCLARGRSPGRRAAGAEGLIRRFSSAEVQS